MTSYSDLQTISQDSQFQGRCQQAAWIQAVFMLNNTDPLPGLVHQFCNKVVQGLISNQILAQGALADPTVSANSAVASLPGNTSVTDAQILTAYQNNFAAMAGVATFPS